MPAPPPLAHCPPVCSPLGEVCSAISGCQSAAVLLPSVPQYVLLHARREALAGRLATAYKALDKVGAAGTALRLSAPPL